MANGMNSVWTEKKFEMLKALWGERKYSASQIATMLGGMSRNAVIGKIHREGLEPRGNRNAVRKPRNKKSKKQTNYGISHRGSIPASDVEVLMMASEKLAIQKVSLEDIKQNQCHWPIGDPTKKDFFFCGGPVFTGQPYCLFHCVKAFPNFSYSLPRESRACSIAPVQPQTPKGDEYGEDENAQSACETGVCEAVGGDAGSVGEGAQGTAEADQGPRSGQERERVGDGRLDRAGGGETPPAQEGVR